MVQTGFLLQHSHILPVNGVVVAPRVLGQCRVCTKFAAELALWERHLLPQEEVPVVWQCVCDGIEGKLESTLWEGLHCGRPQVSCSSQEVPHCLALDSQTCTVGEPGCIVCCLHFGLDLAGDLLLCGTWVLFHHVNHLLERAIGRSPLHGLPQWASLGLPWVAIDLTVGSLEHMYEAAFAACNFLYMVVSSGRSKPPLAVGRNSRLVSADLARPHQRFRYCVARGWSLV